MKTISKVLKQEFDFSYKHLGLFLSDDLWVHDKYIVFINGEDFEYSQGIRFRECSNSFFKDKFNSLINKTPKKTKSNLMMYIEELNKVSKPKKLNLDDVLFSLVLDMQSSDLDFEDFCNEYGYNEDSIKHRDLYEQCRKNSKKLKKFLKNKEEAIELFNQY